MSRRSVTKEGVSYVALKLVTVLLGLTFFLVVVVGGSVYRTDCVATTGQASSTWGLEGDIPYTWSPDASHCRAHSLTRYMLASAGVMSAISSPAQAYTPELVRQVGAGSMAVAQLLPTFEAVKASGGYFAASTNPAMLALLKGQLDKLSPNALATLAQDNGAASTHFGPVLRKLSALEASISGGVVNAGAFPGLPPDSETFISDWNGYVTSLAAALRGINGSLTGLTPVFAEFQQLVEAAYRTISLRSTTQFHRVCIAFLKDVSARYQRVQAAERLLGELQPGEQRFLKFVDGSEDAQVIVARVNHDYPKGFLAQEFKPS